MLKSKEKIIADMLDSDGNRLCSNMIVPWNSGIDLANTNTTFTNTSVSDGKFDLTASSIATSDIGNDFFNNDHTIITHFNVSSLAGYLHTIQTATFNISYLKINSDKLLWVLSDGVSVGTGLTGTTVLTTGVDYLVTLVRSGDDMIIYLNDALDSTRTANFSTVADVDSQWVVGLPAQTIAGNLYSTAWIKKALSADEVAELYKQFTGDYS